MQITEETLRQPGRDESVEDTNALVGQIEAMAESLGRRLYRGILKTVARAWNPSEIREMDVLRKVLDHMQQVNGVCGVWKRRWTRVGPEFWCPFSGLYV